MRKEFTYFLFVVSVLITVFNFVFVKEVKADNKQFLKDNYSGFFMQDGEFKIYSPKTDTFYYMSDTYIKNGAVVYGKPQNVPQATGFTNEYYSSLGTYRFLGLSATPTMPVAHDNMVEDFDTSGDTGGRDYVSYPYNPDVAKNIRNNSVKPTQNNFNIAQRLSNKFALSGKFYTAEQSEQIINDWLYCLDDKYSRNHDYYRKNSKNWIERDTNNQFLTEMSAEKRRKISYIVQPPTEIGVGTIVEWHSVSSLGRDLYDVFPILSNCNGDNFTATQLTAKPINDELRINFSVSANNDIELDNTLPTRLDIWVNGDYVLGYDAMEFGVSWEKHVTKNSYLATIDITNVQADSEITIKATYNPYQEFKEIGYNDNSKIITIKKPRQAQVCTAQDLGEMRNYSVRVCSSWDDEGNCTATICDTRSEYLDYDFDLLYDENKQELEGMWSSNSVGHLTLQVPNATYSTPTDNIWKQKITNHKVPKVTDLKRVIRSGRGLQMYSTINFDFTLTSFDGEQDLKNKANKMYQTLMKNLYAVGIEIEGENNGVVKNHLGKTKAPTQLDNTRVKIDGKYIKFVKGSVSKTPYGDSSCTRIYKYKQEFKVVIPIKTKNEDNKIQETKSKGDFGTTKSYNVANSVDTFFTNIDTMNGGHALQFQNTIKFSEVDSASSKEKLCKAKQEKFGVWGNIYDDVRVQDSTEKEKGKNDFNF